MYYCKVFKKKFFFFFLLFFAFQLSLGYIKTNALNQRKAGLLAELPPAPMPGD